MIYALLNDNLASNLGQKGFTPRLNVRNQCVGHRNGHVQLSSTISDGQSMGRQLRYDGEEKINYGGIQLGTDGAETTMVTIDSLELKSLDVLKVDAEGAEPLVSGIFFCFFLFCPCVDSIRVNHSALLLCFFFVCVIFVQMMPNRSFMVPTTPFVDALLPFSLSKTTSILTKIHKMHSR